MSEPVTQPTYYGSPRPTSIMAIVALMLSLVGGGIFAVIFGHLAIEDIKNTGKDGKGLAITALIFGYLQTALWVIFFIFLLVGLDSSAFDDPTKGGRQGDLTRTSQAV